MRVPKGKQAHSHSHFQWKSFCKMNTSPTRTPRSHWQKAEEPLHSEVNRSFLKVSLKSTELPAPQQQLLLSNRALLRTNFLPKAAILRGTPAPLGTSIPFAQPHQLLQQTKKFLQKKNIELVRYDSTYCIYKSSRK